MIKYLKAEAGCILDEHQLKVYSENGYELVTFSTVPSGKYIYYFKDIGPSKNGEKIEPVKEYLFNEINACCPYCDFQSRGDFFKVTAVMKEHEVFCSKHPMRKLEAKNKELKESLFSILKYVKTSASDLDEFYRDYCKAVKTLNEN